MPDWAPSHKKVETIIVKDFQNYPSDVLPHIAHHDACIWALGMSSVGLSEEAYTTITYGYVEAAVNALQKAGVTGSETSGNPFRLVFISGAGADLEGKGTIMFKRVRQVFQATHIRSASENLEVAQGRTEKFLLDLPESSGIKGEHPSTGVLLSEPSRQRSFAFGDGAHR